MLGQKMPLFLRYWAGENCFQWCSQAMSPAVFIDITAQILETFDFSGPTQSSMV